MKPARYSHRNGISLGIYCEFTGRKEIPNFDFYMAFGMFRLVGILQGIVKRFRDGNASNANAADSGKRTRAVAEAGWKQALKKSSQRLSNG